MRQLTLFEDNPNALSGVLPAIRAAMNATAGASEEGRKLLVDRLNAVASSANVRLTAGNSKFINKDTLDKWLSPSDRDHTPSILAVVAFCMATKDVTTMRAILRPLGLDVMTPEDRRFRDYGRTCIESKAKAKVKRRLEDEILEGLR